MSERFGCMGDGNTHRECLRTGLQRVIEQSYDLDRVRKCADFIWIPHGTFVLFEPV